MSANTTQPITHLALFRLAAELLDQGEPIDFSLANQSVNDGRSVKIQISTSSYSESAIWVDLEVAPFDESQVVNRRGLTQRPTKVWIVDLQSENPLCKGILRVSGKATLYLPSAQKARVKIFMPVENLNAPAPGTGNVLPVLRAFAARELAEYLGFPLEANTAVYNWIISYTGIKSTRLATDYMLTPEQISEIGLVLIKVQQFLDEVNADLTPSTRLNLFQAILLICGASNRGV